MFINSTTEIETRLSISLISASSKFYHGHSDLIVKYNVGLKNVSATWHIRVSSL